MTSRRFPPPWQVEQISGGYKVLDSTGGQALAYVYARETQQQVDAAKALTFDEARRIAVNVAKLPGPLRSEDWGDAPSATNCCHVGSLRLRRCLSRSR
jgi:hypothetical protein